MDDGTCPGNCNSAYRKSRVIYDAAMSAHRAAVEKLADGDPVPDPPAAPDIRPWYGEPVWCARCQGVIRRDLCELDDLAALLAAMPPGIRPATTGQRQHVKVSGTRGTLSPSPPADMLEELCRWLRNWESIARTRRVYDGGDTAIGADPVPRRGHLATDITTGVAWLYHHFDSIIMNADHAEHFGAEVLVLYREFTAAAHAGSAAKHIKKPCPRCSQYTLWETLGEDYISCVNEDCNRRLTRGELEAENGASVA